MHILKSQEFSDECLLEFARSPSTKKGDIEDQILHWDFGPIMEMKNKVDAENYLFSSEKVPFHWDGAFFKVPSKLLFYCTESSGRGEKVFLQILQKFGSRYL